MTTQEGSERWSVDVQRQRRFKGTTRTPAAHYRLRFTYEEGASMIHVRFVGYQPHDSISVYDHRKGAVTVSSKADVKVEVSSYMRHASKHDLAAAFDHVIHSHAA